MKRKEKMGGKQYSKKIMAENSKTKKDMNLQIIRTNKSKARQVKKST